MLKKILCLMLALAMVAVVPALAAETQAGTQTETVTISMRVEGVSENLGVWKKAILPGKPGELTVADAVRALIGENQYTESEGPYGTYFTSIFGEEEGMGTYGGWNYCVNGQSPSVSMGQYTLQGGEDIVLYYGDLDTLVPILESEDGVLTVTALVWQEGEDGQWVQAAQPVPGVSVLWDGETLGQTDEKGQIVLPQAEPGRYSLQIEKNGAEIEGSGGTRFMPQVVRLAPDAVFVVDTAPVFSDLPREHRAYDAVMALYRAQIVNGKEEHVFGTDDALTRAEAVAMLYRLAGSPAVSQEEQFGISPSAWYHDAAVWAISLGVLQGSTAFDAGAAVKGGEFAACIAAYQGSAFELPHGVGIYDVVSRAEAAILLAELL